VETTCSDKFRNQSSSTSPHQTTYGIIVVLPQKLPSPPTDCNHVIHARGEQK